jgi:biopolymer transport protein TolR
MGMATGGGGEGEAVCEINVTPMVDVLLCLLIIFMVAAPKPPNEQIEISVPKESVTQVPSDPNSPLLVEVTDDGSAKLGQLALSKDFDEMVKQFKDNEKVMTDGKVVVTAKGAAKYGDVIRVMTAAHEAGVDDVGIASDRL